MSSVAREGQWRLLGKRYVRINGTVYGVPPRQDRSRCAASCASVRRRCRVLVTVIELDSSIAMKTSSSCVTKSQAARQSGEV
jgi:hypothetical protein